jgi:type I restriction enzyme S subunit
VAGYPYVAIPQIKNGRLDLSDVRLISPEHFVEWTRKANPQPYDVILSRRCNPGETAFVPLGFQGALGQNLVLLRADGKKVFPPFLRWLVRSPDWWEQVGTFINVGAVFDSLKCADIPSFRLPVPPLDEQKVIAHILRTLDDKIELNQQMNHTLEAIARALFKSWFINFDPVRAKMDGRQPAGMDAATAALFPAEFEDSAIGKIPKGWRFATINQICNVTRGASPRPIHDYMGGEVPWIKIADATGAGGIFLFETKEKLKREGISKSVSVIPGDLILSNSATCGVPMFVEIEGCIHDGWLLFRDFNSTSKSYLFHHLIVISERLIHIADGSVQKNLNTKLVGNQEIIVPQPTIVNLFDGINKHLLDKMHLNIIQSRSLTSIRDSLLPKLLSGEIRVTDAEKLLELVA